MATSTLEDLKTKKFYAALLAELLGTMFLVICACGSAIVVEGSNIVRISLAFAFSIATLVWATAHVSGGHLNPAVTLGFLVTRKISVGRFMLYCIVQMIGALLGAGILWLIHEPNHGGLGTTVPAPGISQADAFGIELMITFILVWTVFATVDEHRNMGGSGPLAIGLAIGMCHLYAVPFTGAGMNPARVFGPAVVKGEWDSHWAYWVGPAVGGVVAAILYEFVFASNATPKKLAGYAGRDYDDKEYAPPGDGFDVGKKHGNNHELHVVQ